MQSRYYDPNTGRFLNADGLLSTGEGLTGYNMFAYCNNNPVLLNDEDGTRPAVGTCSGSMEPEEERAQSFAAMYKGNQNHKFVNSVKKMHSSKYKSESHSFKQMAIDTDGSAKGSVPDQNHQDDTSYKHLDATKINYVVVPKAQKYQLGDIAEVIDHSTGQYVYAIVGDTGHAYGEVSVSVAWDLGYKDATGLKGPAQKLGNKFEIKIYDGSSNWGKGNISQDQIDAEGESYYW